MTKESKCAHEIASFTTMQAEYFIGHIMGHRCKLCGLYIEHKDLITNDN